MILQFICNWPRCGKQFEQDVRKYTSIICPQCKGWLKQEEGTEKPVDLNKLDVQFDTLKK